MNRVVIGCTVQLLQCSDAKKGSGFESNFAYLGLEGLLWCPVGMLEVC